MATRSLNARITLGAGVVLAVFIVLSALALERAFRESARSAREERLLAQVYLLMAAAEVNSAGILSMSDRTLEPRFDAPDSGLYASIIGGNGQPVWQSGSTISVALPKTAALTAGSQSFAHTSGKQDGNYLVKAFGVNWATANDTSYPFTFVVAEDASAYEAQLDIYRRNLWTWLGVMAIFLLASQWLILRWGLAPLRHVSDELNRLEAGDRQELGGNYPVEIQRLVDSLNSVLSHERRQQQRYRNALGDLAHSLKTPLALIRGAVREENLESKKTIENQVDEMDRHVGYHLQRAAASGRSALVTPVPVHKIARRIVTALTKVYADKKPVIRIDLAEDIVFRGDEGDLTEILGNLLDNACKWCRTTVRIVAQLEGQALHIGVEDDGPGIADADAAHVLLRGARADQTTPGHGIGLAVVREIVEAYNGSIQISKSDLGGARLNIRIPQAS